ncbi:MAG: hypothetical protein ACI4J6_11730 [Oscillospiraceae bacterium]
MALINCPECKKEISDTVRKCPNCGYTIKKFDKKTFIIVGISLLVVIIAVVSLVILVPLNKYNNALKLLEAEDYQNALISFKSLGDYSDSLEKIDYINKKIDYLNAKNLKENGDFEKAKDILISLNGFEDSDQLISDINNEIDYKEATTLINSEKYDEAKRILISLDGYKDSAKLLDDVNNEIIYQSAFELLYKAEFEDAIKEFETISSYKDTKDILSTIKNEKKLFKGLNNLRTELIDPSSFELREVWCYKGVDTNNYDFIIEFSGSNKMGGKTISYAMFTSTDLGDNEPILVGTSRQEYVQSLDDTKAQIKSLSIDYIYEYAIGILIYCDLYGVTNIDGKSYEEKQLVDFPMDIKRLNEIIMAN